MVSVRLIPPPIEPWCWATTQLEQGVGASLSHEHLAVIRRRCASQHGWLPCLGDRHEGSGHFGLGDGDWSTLIDLLAEQGQDRAAWAQHIFEPHASNRCRPELHRGMDQYVLASHRASFPWPAVEATAAGLPIAASNILKWCQSLWRVRHRGEDEMMGGWPLGCGRRSFLEPRARSQSGARPEGPGSVASSTNPRF